MKDLVIRWLEAITGAAFFLIIAWCALIGFSAFTTVGLPRIAGVLIGLFVGFMIAVVCTGVIYLLISIHEHLRQITRDSGPAA